MIAAMCICVPAQALAELVPASDRKYASDAGPWLVSTFRG